MRLTLITLALLLLTLTACNDPLGIVAAEQVRSDGQVQIAQIQADASTEQAQIDASTARVRIGGWMVAVGILAVVLVLCVLIVGMVHLQAQRDRLQADVAIRTASALPAPPQQHALPPLRQPASQPKPGHWLALRRPDPQQRRPMLALPERSETQAHEIVVIDG